MMIKPTFIEAFRYWLRLGFISFGGPTGQIAMMHKELVDKRKWISESHFLQALNFCMLLPGPEAQQLATYIGWLMHKTWGGIVAGTLFVLPSIFVLMGLSWLYVTMGTVPEVAALLYGLKPAVVAIVAEAVLRIAKKALKNWFFVTMAAASFIAIYVFSVPFPIIVFGAAVMGFAAKQIAPQLFGSTVTTQSEADTLIGGLAAQMRDTGWRPAISTAATWLTVWAVPLICVWLWKGQSIFSEPRLSLQQGRHGYIRRGLCSSRLRRTGGSTAFRVAETPTDDGCSCACRDDSWSADHGQSVCRVPGSIPEPRRSEPGDRRCCGRATDYLGHLCAFFPDDIPPGPLYRSASQERPALNRFDGSYCRCGRCSAESRCDVHAERLVS